MPITRELPRELAAEVIGTFALVFCGCGAPIVAQEIDASSAGGLLLVALAHGAILVVCVAAFLRVSGAQFNPAVSIALIISGKQSPAKAALFIAVQLFAAAAACGMLVLILGRETADGAANLGATFGSLTHQANPVPLVLLEAVMTFFLMSIILNAIVDGQAETPIAAGLCVGLVVAAAIAASGPLSGASFNPARSFGPALYGHWDAHWAYWVGPTAGACAAAGLHRLIGKRG